MKIARSPRRVILGMTLSVVTSLLVSSPRLHAAPPPGYTLVWSDEFDSSTLDYRYWNHSYPGVYRDGFNSPTASAVANGNLTITAYTEGGVHYTDHLDTKGKYQPKYGYMEASICFSNAPGNWSAFWMFAPTIGATNQPHTDGVELDIVEHREVNQYETNIADQIPSTLHWDGYAANHKSVTSGLRGAGLSSGFHTYGMEWTPDYLKFYIDGSYLYTVNNSTATDPVPPLAPVPQRSEYLLLSTEILTGSWAGNIPAGGFGSLATSESQMIVDYVRVYQTTPPMPPVPASVTAANVNHRSITLSWTMSDNTPSYNVKRSLTSGGPYKTIANSGVGYVDTNVIPDTTYYYVVSAVNGPNESANSAEVSGTPLPSDTHEGLWSGQVTLAGGTPSYAALRQTVPVAANTNYKAGIWVKGSGRLRLLIRPPAGTPYMADKYMTATSTWVYHEVSFNSGVNTSALFYVDDSSLTAGTVYVDDAFLGLAGGTNLLANPGFESGNTVWTTYQPATWKIRLAANTHSGTGSTRGTFTGTPSYHSLRQYVNVTPSTAYQTGLWMKGSGKVRVMVRQASDGTYLASQYVTVASPDWTYYTLPFNSGANTQVFFYIDDSSNIAGTVYVDDVFLGLSGGPNMLLNPGFESGAASWTSSNTAKWKSDQY
jgi:beta-glucanase (GH16 family)